MDMWWGDNGRTYKLYENDILIDTQQLADDSPNAQSAVTSVAYRKNGTYRYYAELINAYGTTRSDVRIVEVAQAAPGDPVLSHDNDDGDGSYNVKMNMWWGTNGGTYRLYENGVLIDTQALTEATPQAQTAVTAVAGRPPGTYEYRCELENGAGVASSGTIQVIVKPS
uniref:chitinase N-terminal domain-containing protein n=1 Tax=Cohnella rhizosphaerae TaxID=1457232 RepID=UPI003B8A821D